MVKRSFSYIPMIMILSLMSVIGLYTGLRENISDVLTPEARAIIITNMIEMFTSLSVPTMVAIFLYPAIFSVKEEKDDKVFEHLFLSPLSPLKIILYRFAAFIPFLILCCTIVCLLNFLAVLIAVPDIPSNIYSLTLLLFILLIILGLPLCYIAILNGFIIPQKYFIIAILLIFTLPIGSIIGLASLLSVTQSTPFEAFRLATIIASIIITMIGIIETTFMKDRIVEMVITV